MDRDLTKDLPIKQIIRLMIPLLIGLLGQQLYVIVDTRIISMNCSVIQRAGINAAAPLITLTYAVYAGISLAVSIIVSQVYGRKNTKKLREALNTGIVTSIIASLIFTVIGLIIMPLLLRLMHTPESMYNYSKTYLILYYLGLIFQITYSVNDAIFNGIGNTKATLKFIIVGNIVNIILDYILIIQFKLGVLGAGIAVLISNAVMCIMSYTLLNKWFKKDKIKVFKEKELFNIKICKEIIKLMIPSIGLQFIVAVSSMAMQYQYNKFEEVVISALGIAVKIEVIVTIATTAIMKAVIPFTGQNIGAKRIDRIKKAYNESVVLGMFIMFIMSVITFIFAEEMMTFFVREEASIKIGTGYLKISSLFFALTAVNNTNQSIFRGASDMKDATSSIVFGNFVKVIFAYIAIPKIGLMGIYLSTPVMLIAGSVYSYVLYRKGYWESKEIKTTENNINNNKLKEVLQ